MALRPSFPVLDHRKPGSGKSTLMKFLVAHKETSKELRTWAADGQLVVASHFLWIGGNAMQKSQRGLLQSILCDILRQEPGLIEYALPVRWKKLATEPYYLYRQGDSAPSYWEFFELEAAFRRLSAIQMFRFCYCIFIDGLDEYHGDKDEVIKIVKSLASMPNIKLCVSSRPWNVFDQAFGNTLSMSQQLLLQDLNSEAIRLYVQENLEDSDEFQCLISRDDDATNISQEIVKNAKGVFLWVFLVVRSLKEGLQNFDRLVDLQNRLREFLADLDAFFRHMFDSMDKVYRIPASRAFQVALSTRDSLSLLNYWYIDIEETDPDFLLNLSNNTLSKKECDDRKSLITKRLNGRLKGLLEVHGFPPSGSVNCEPRVDFLHRTVEDFLMTEEMQALLRDWSTPSFNPHELICKTLLAELKSNLYWRKAISERRENDTSDLGDLMINFFYCAKEFESTAHRSAIALVVEMESVTKFIKNCSYDLNAIELRNTPWHEVVKWKLLLATSDWLAQQSSQLSS